MSCCQIPGKCCPLHSSHRCHEVGGKDLALKLSLKLMKTIIINIKHKSSENRNPSPFCLVWAWEMGHSRMLSGFQVAGHTKVTMLLCIPKMPREDSLGWGQWGAEGIYSTVIKKGRLMCKYKGHMGRRLVIGKRKVLLSSCPKPSQEQGTETWGCGGIVETVWLPRFSIWQFHTEKQTGQDQWAVNGLKISGQCLGDLGHWSLLARAWPFCLQS